MNIENNKTKKSSYHHGDLRQQLLNEAVLLIREEGLAGLSMRKLAINAGVSRTAAYHHFKDKDDLLSAIAAEGFERFQKLHRDAVDRGLDLASREGAMEFNRAYVKFATENPEYYDLMFGGQIWKSASLTESLKKVSFATFRDSVVMVKELQDRGAIRSDLDPLRFAQVRWSTMHGMSRLMIDGIYIDSSAVDAMCETAVDMMLAYIH
ncbi:MAG: TetR/AcrR family transcriptional regulator [Candidatus Pelagadaptatus aseana]|uniref:TetR/AcrR family transcriptional regulator n=1 Tax=Candidatus Pelagadaptatus aseana TaxID=3120508 RepID=UPI0039B2B41E